MADKKQDGVSADELFAIEELKRRHKVKESVFKGMVSLEGWKAGKFVSEKDFEVATNKFLNSSMNGKDVNGNVKGR